MRGRNGRLQVWRKRVAESGFRHGWSARDSSGTPRGAGPEEDPRHDGAHRGGRFDPGLEVQGDHRSVCSSQLPRLCGPPRSRRSNSWNRSHRSPENMSPAVLADPVARRLGRGRLDASTKLRIRTLSITRSEPCPAPSTVHSRKVFPSATAGVGMAAGAGLYLASHGTALPLLRIQKPPWRLPRAAFAWEFTSHLLFGLALELGCRSASRILAVRSRASRPAEDGLADHRPLICPDSSGLGLRQGPSVPPEGGRR